MLTTNTFHIRFVLFFSYTTLTLSCFRYKNMIFLLQNVSLSLNYSVHLFSHEKYIVLWLLTHSFIYAIGISYSPGHDSTWIIQWACFWSTIFRFSWCCFVKEMNLKVHFLMNLSLTWEVKGKQREKSACLSAYLLFYFFFPFFFGKLSLPNVYPVTAHLFFKTTVYSKIEYTLLLYHVFYCTLASNMCLNCCYW